MTPTHPVRVYLDGRPALCMQSAWHRLAMSRFQWRLAPGRVEWRHRDQHVSGSMLKSTSGDYPLAPTAGQVFDVADSVDWFHRALLFRVGQIVDPQRYTLHVHQLEPGDDLANTRWRWRLEVDRTQRRQRVYYGMDYDTLQTIADWMEAELRAMAGRG